MDADAAVHKLVLNIYIWLISINKSHMSIWRHERELLGSNRCLQIDSKGTNNNHIGCWRSVSGLRKDVSIERVGICQSDQITSQQPTNFQQSESTTFLFFIFLFFYFYFFVLSPIPNHNDHHLLPFTNSNNDIVKTSFLSRKVSLSFLLDN